MIRRVLLISVVVAALFATGLVAILVDAVYSTPDTRGENPEPVLFAVAQGEPFSRVSLRLDEAGLVGKRRAVEIYAWLRRYDRQVKAGTYRLHYGQKAHEILETLVTGDVYKVTATIPEGFMHQQIAGVLGAVADIDSVAFAALLTDKKIREDLGVKGPSLEGYLFPDTYIIPWGTTPEDIARMMGARLIEVFDDDLLERTREVDMTRHEVLTLASIVEAETRLSEELPLVSAVYHNRLKRNMRLEADPTVAYAMGGYKGRLYFKDLEIDSPYNTYKNDGLPPGPIGNPGRAAIMAALYPDTNCRALYFVARGQGGHVFSLTLDEHLSAIRTIRREKKSN